MNQAGDHLKPLILKERLSGPHSGRWRDEDNISVPCIKKTIKIPLSWSVLVLPKDSWACAVTVWCVTQDSHCCILQDWVRRLLTHAWHGWALSPPTTMNITDSFNFIFLFFCSTELSSCAFLDSPPTCPSPHRAPETSQLITKQLCVRSGCAGVGHSSGSLRRAARVNASGPPARADGAMDVRAL